MSESIYFDTITPQQFFDCLSEAEDIELPLRCSVCKGTNWIVEPVRASYFDPNQPRYVRSYHRLEFRLTCDRCACILRFDAERLGFSGI